MEHLVKDVLAPYAVECIVYRNFAQQAATFRLLSPRTPPTREIKLFPIAVRFYDVNSAGITDALINFCGQADETSGGICELLATSMEMVGLSLE
ncbi:hypothetical protein IscW_ISCW003112 [Ixodes scapularis]|uniref:Uncharacterized protein n=1 Tax=Ixodes scapularis TaxID=6945 RepID=B7PBE1_IXOSC|nr:hypothetical protein IscW_ISCW003112 [Ixodes scapularis]|eukprot:XP_002407993.1 hypothetical protein IscW_ISCW003112 [Ixodes scapularis]